MSKKGEVILTGFGPFGEVSSNPTEKLMRSLEDELQDELYQLFVLPVSYSHCKDWSEKHISENTKLVIHFGVSVKSEVILLERTGRNVIGSNQDINGSTLGERVLAEGPETINSSVDLEALSQEMKALGYKCDVSDNAGDYLCNFILYKSLFKAPDKSIFVHVPPEEKVSVAELKKFTLQMLRSLKSQGL